MTPDFHKRVREACERVDRIFNKTLAEADPHAEVRLGIHDEKEIAFSSPDKAARFFELCKQRLEAEDT